MTIPMKQTLHGVTPIHVRQKLSSVLIVVWQHGTLVTAPLDSNGDPIVANTQDVIRRFVRSAVRFACVTSAESTSHCDHSPQQLHVPGGDFYKPKPTNQTK
jgi:hypothetical protein